MTQATAPAHRQGSHRRILWLSIILSICLVATEIVALILLGNKDDDLAFTIAGFFVFGSGLSWIAYAILRAGWAPVVGIIAVIGAGLAIYFRSSWIFVGMWVGAAVCASKIAFSGHWNLRKWLVMDVLLGPFALLLSVIVAYREHRAARPVDKPFPDDQQDLPEPTEISRLEEEKPPIKEFRESVFKEWLDVRSFWKDRRLLLNDVKEIRTNPRKLSSKALAFAIAGAVVPAFLITESYSAIVSISRVPKPSVERGIEEQNAKKEKFTKIISDIDKLAPLALKEPNSTHGRSNEQLQAELNRLTSSLKKKNKLAPKQRASMERQAEILDAVRQGRRLDQQLTSERQEAEAERAKADIQIKGLGALNCLQKLGETVDKWKPRLMAAAFVLTAYLFAFLMRHMKSRPRYHFLAVDSYLYTLGLALFLPNVVGALAFVAADLSVRYDFDPYLKVHNYLAGAILLWIAVVLVLNAKRVAVGIDDRAGSYPAYARRIYWRLLLSQLAVGLLIEGSVAFIGVPLYMKIVRCPA